MLASMVSDISSSDNVNFGLIVLDREVYISMIVLQCVIGRRIESMSISCQSG